LGISYTKNKSNGINTKLSALRKDSMIKLTKHKNYDYIIAIDPDVDKSGLAELYPSTGDCELSSRTFPELIDEIISIKKESEMYKQTLIVVIEIDTTTTHNWRINSKMSRQMIATMGHKQGRNYQVAQTLIQYMEFYGVEYVKQAPLRKGWRGREGKITHEELMALKGLKFTKAADQRMTQTNQEERDAALLAIHWSNIPLIIDNSIYKKRGR